jgi:hypothetical protein
MFIEALFKFLNSVFLIKVSFRLYQCPDTGTIDSLMQGGLFVQIFKKKQGIRILIIEGIAFSMSSGNKDQLLDLAILLETSGYGKHLINM